LMRTKQSPLKRPGNRRNQNAIEAVGPVDSATQFDGCRRRIATATKVFTAFTAPKQGKLNCIATAGESRCFCSQATRATPW
jgi:hypothetical protein